MFLNKRDMADKIGLSCHTLRRYRERGDWLQGIHYIKVSQNVVLYNEELVLNWFANRGNPAAHERAIERYLASLDEETTTAGQTRKRSNKRAG